MVSPPQKRIDVILMMMNGEKMKILSTLKNLITNIKEKIAEAGTQNIDITKELNPVIAKKIDAFMLRRKVLLRRRGIYVLITSFFCMTLIVALIDYFILMEDIVRHILSLTLYTAVTLILWLTTLRKTFANLSKEDVAKMIESTHPELREALLSAVELQVNGNNQRFDSALFRKLIQEEVAGRVEPLVTEELLPFSMIGKWLKAALITVAITVILLLIPGMHYGRLLLRAAVPIANIARVSKTVVKIITPIPASRTVPQGDSIPVIIEISGKAANKSWIETFERNKSTGRTLMRHITKNRFTAHVQVGRKSVQYRIRTGDAITQKHTLTAVPRPHVIHFNKTITPPDYTAFEKTVLKDNHGNIKALEGSTVQLILEVDQPIAEGSVTLTTPKKTIKLPLEAVTKKKLSTNIKIKHNATYKVQLISAKTKFDNKFSPRYEIESIPDLAPVVDILKPEKNMQVVPSQLITINVHATDDLAVRSLSQMYRINSSAWTNHTAIQNLNTRDINITNNWDLSILGLRAGDEVFTKFISKDSKGNIGESSLLKLSVSSPGFDLARLKRLKSRKRLNKAMSRFSDNGLKVSQIRKSALSDEQPWDKNRIQQERLKLLSAIKDTKTLINNAETEIKRTILADNDDPANADLINMRRTLSSLNHNNLDMIEHELRSIDSDTPPEEAQKIVKKAAEKLAIAHWQPNKVTAISSQLLMDTSIRVAQEDLNMLAAEQERINKIAKRTTNKADADILKRRRKAVLDTANKIGDMIDESGEAVEWGQRKTAINMNKQLKQKLKTAQKALDEDKPDIDTLLKNAISAAKTSLGKLETSADKTGRKQRENFERHVESSATPVAKLNTALQASMLATNDTQLAKQFEARLKATQAVLKERADTEELRKNSDPKFARDIGRVSDGLEKLSAKKMTPEQGAIAQKRLASLQKSLKTIETANAIKQMSNDLLALATREQWDAESPNKAVEVARRWEVLKNQLHVMNKKLPGLTKSSPVRKQVKDAAESAAVAQIQKEMKARKTAGKRQANMSKPMQQVAESLKQASKNMEQELKDARADIANSAPTLAEHLTGLESTAATIKKKSAILVKDATKDSVKINPRVKELLEDQKKLNKQLNDIQAALRRDANTQNLDNKQSIERARDADDARAMLRDTPSDTEESLRNALRARTPEAMSKSLARAQQQQEKTEKRLALLADHYKNLENGKPEQTRAQLREQEKILGIKKSMDAEYAAAERLAELAELAQSANPNAALQKLENELSANKNMKEALSQLADNIKNEAGDNLNSISKTEQELKKRLDAMHKKQIAAEKALTKRMQDLSQKMKKLATTDIPKTAATSQSKNAGSKANLQKSASNLQAGRNQLPKSMKLHNKSVHDAIKQAIASLEKAKAEMNTALTKQNTLAQKTSARADISTAKKGDAKKMLQQAQAVANQNSAIAKEAASILSKMEALQKQNQHKQQQMANRQKKAVTTAKDTGNELSKAGRHMSRLGKKQGAQLQQLGKKTDNNASQEMSKANKALASQSSPNTAQAPVNAAAQAMQQRMSDFNSLPTADKQPEQAVPTAKWLARALDKMDSAMQDAEQSQAQQGKNSNNPPDAKPNSKNSQNALAQANKSQSKGMANARSRGRVPGEPPRRQETESSGGGSSLDFADEQGDLAKIFIKKKKDDGKWAKLKKKRANDLMNAKREEVPREYRSRVDAYFRGIAETAEKKSQER